MAELISWLDPSNVETPLNGETFYTALRGRQNFFMPPANIVSQQIPLQPGVRDKYVQIGAGDPRLPVLVQADVESNLAIARRRLVAAMNPLRGIGTLRATAQDGAVKDLSCRLIDGLRGDESSGHRGPAWFMAGLIFQASDPYWYDRDWTTLTFSTAAPVTFLANPFLGLNISASGISSSFSVFNAGDVECWPIWTITGPGNSSGNSITITNQTTGAVFSTSIILAAGQVLTIDTRPGVKTVKREDGSNQFATVLSTSKLWSLAPGNNVIALSMLATTGASQLQLQYKQRWMGV